MVLSSIIFAMKNWQIYLQDSISGSCSYPNAMDMWGHTVSEEIYNNILLLNYKILYTLIISWFFLIEAIVYYIHPVYHSLDPDPHPLYFFLNWNKSDPSALFGHRFTIPSYFNPIPDLQRKRVKSSSENLESFLSLTYF